MSSSPPPSLPSVNTNYILKSFLFQLISYFGNFFLYHFYIFCAHYLGNIFYSFHVSKSDWWRPIFTDWPPLFCGKLLNDYDMIRSIFFSFLRLDIFRQDAFTTFLLFSTIISSLEKKLCDRYSPSLPLASVRIYWHSLKYNNFSNFLKNFHVE